MHEWEQQLNHAGQRPIRSLSLFLSLLSPSASSRLYTTARLPSTSHQAYTSTKSLARPNGFYNGRKRMGEATKRSNWTTTCNVSTIVVETPVGIAPAKSSFQWMLASTFISSTHSSVYLSLDHGKGSFLPKESYTDDSWKYLIPNIALVVPLLVSSLKEEESKSLQSRLF